MRVSLAQRSVSDALRSWALLLDCPVGYLERQRVDWLERDSSDGPFVMTFVRGDVGLVSLPNSDSRDFDLESDELQSLIAITRAETHVGETVQLRDATLEVENEPAALVVVDNQTLTGEPRVPASLVYDPRAAVLDMLRHEVTPQDWHQGGGGLESPHRVGALAGGVLVALASVTRPVGHMARIRVVVAPTHRRRGFGRLVLRALARHVIDQGLIPFCRLAANDVAARALATAVGFVAFAHSLTMRVTSIGSSDSVPSNSNPALG